MNTDWHFAVVQNWLNSTARRYHERLDKDWLKRQLENQPAHQQKSKSIPSSLSKYGAGSYSSESPPTATEAKPGVPPGPNIFVRAYCIESSGSTAEQTVGDSSDFP